VADIDGRTACQEPIELAVQTGLMIEATDFAAEINDLNDKEPAEPTVAPFDEYLIDVPVLDIGPSDFFCEPTTVPLDATVPGAESYQWNTGATTAEILAEVPGIYFVEDTSHMECWILRDTAVFNILPPPVVTIGADTTGFCETGIATLSAIAVGAESLFWSTGATSSTITVSEAGAYTVQAQNMCGTVIQSFTLVLPDCDGPQGECRLEIPNVFTPDGDGVNDRFRPLSNCEVYDEYSLRIYSRWGELVFTSTSSTEAWDGSYQNKPMASDLFAWILEYRFPGQEEADLKKGEVTLIR
jgi:gliding motility-associated-like protein